MIASNTSGIPSKDIAEPFKKELRQKVALNSTLQDSRLNALRHKFQVTEQQKEQAEQSIWFQTWAFGGVISDEEAWHLVNYVRRLSAQGQTGP